MKKSIIISALLSLCFGLIFFYAPVEKAQGMVQKIFYIHVSSAITMYIGFFIAFVSGLSFIFTRKIKHIHRLHASAEVAYLFICIVLLTGPIWAKPIWGTYWTWEPRLTTTFILWLIYTGYLLFDAYLKDNDQSAPMISSIIAVIAFVNVPLIHFSVKLFRGVHPSVIKTKGGLPQSMTLALIFTLFVFICLFFYLFSHRYRLERLERQLHERLS